jgi:hypothetical protein
LETKKLSLIKRGSKKGEKIMKVFLGTLDMNGRPCFGAGDILEGETHMDVLNALIDPPFFTMNTEKDPDKFMLTILERANKFGKFKLKISGDMLEERVDSFFKVLMDNKLACYVN